MIDSKPPITRNDVPMLLMGACPSFAARWEAIRKKNEYEDAPGGRLHYVDAGDFIRHLASLKIAEAVEEFPAVFDLIERMVVEGDEYVSELAVIGYIEGFQMAAVTVLGLDPEVDFRPWLRPTSEAYWRAINRLWEDGTPIPTITPD